MFYIICAASFKRLTVSKQVNNEIFNTRMKKSIRIEYTITVEFILCYCHPLIMPVATGIWRLITIRLL